MAKTNNASRFPFIFVQTPNTPNNNKQPRQADREKQSRNWKLINFRMTVFVYCYIGLQTRNRQ